MKLFYAPHVCSLAPHIILRELGRPFELARVDLRRKKLADGRDFAEITRKSYVPALVMDDGSLFTEVSVIVQYLADLQPESRLAPPRGTMERLRLDELVSFIATELHKAFLPFTLMPAVGHEAKDWAARRLAQRVGLLEEMLGRGPYFGGDDFTIADAYAFWALRKFVDVTHQELPARLADYVPFVGERPSVRDALAAEGILPAAPRADRTAP
ncbi:glutathione S-transferase N-terminal domain-containing protein [Pendulispora albinea]|uniref:Glutathione S-transferase N-terminal domain-containing protein n=1 Tax=Pendulispora albinea TaxID=2741071 RepID=A0ABZ2MAM5_9BACT